MRRSLFLFSIILILSTVLSFAPQGPAAWSEEKIDAVPCNPDASADAKAVLAYLAALSEPAVHQAIVGQNCYHGDEITDGHALKGYDRLIAELHRQTGQWAGMVSLDYEYMKLYSAAELSTANQVLIGHWKKGGLVTINLSPLNPWVLDDTGVKRKPDTWDGPGSPTDRTNARLKDLIDPQQPVSKNWKEKLDRIAAALLELKEAGVVVLWRPLQENNGYWFWWGADPDGFKAVYRDMYRYFTVAKKLDNLLWVYSPFGPMPEFRTYPGDDVVDVVAPTCYQDGLYLNPLSYEALEALGNPRKPMGLGEYGPEIGGPVAKAGSLDDRLYIKRIRQNYPRVAYWVSWHGYPGESWSIIDNKNYKELMNDPDVITIERMNWRKKK